MKKKVVTCCLLGVIMAGCSLLVSHITRDKEKDTLSLYLLVGSYASPLEEGVKLYRFDESSGEATYLSGMKGLVNPSFLVPSIEGSRIYVVEEGRGDSAAVNTVYFDKGATKLSVLNRQMTQGNEPCHVAMNPSCHFVVTANYSGSNISIFSMDIDGKLKPQPSVVFFDGSGPVADRQEMAHPHCISFTPDHNYMLVNDLGSDCIHLFPVSVFMTQGASHSLIEEDELESIHLPAGSGPRHIEFHPNGRYAYLINELSGMVTVLEYHDGNLRVKQNVLADERHAHGAADIHVSRDGRFVYASVRLQNDGIAIFEVEPETGFLTKIGYQKTDIHPRNFILTPDGEYLLAACRDSNTIQIFKIDRQTGLLTDTGKKIKTEQPACLQFVR